MKLVWLLEHSMAIGPKAKGAWAPSAGHSVVGEFRGSILSPLCLDVFTFLSEGFYLGF